MKRHARLALAAFLLLGTITTLAAPESQRQTKLRRMQDLIRTLREVEAQQDGLEAYLGDDGKRVVEVHRLGDLTARRTEFIGPNLILQPASAELDESAPQFGKAQEGEHIFLSADEIRDLIVTQVRPGAFGASGARILVTEAGDLMVLADLCLQDEVRSFLAEIREGVGKQVTVEARVLRIHPEAELRIPGALLSREAGLRFLEQVETGQGVQVVHSTRLTGFNGQRVFAWQGAQRAFVQDIDVGVSGDTHVLDPIVGILQTGLKIDVRSTIADGNSVAMDLRVQVTAVSGPLRTIGTKGGLVGAPKPEVVAFDSTVTIANGGFVLLRGKSGNAPHLWALLLSTVVERIDRAPRSGMNEAEIDQRISELVRTIEKVKAAPVERVNTELVFRMHDVAGLIRAIPQGAGEDINLMPSGGFGFGFGDEEDLDPIQTFTASMIEKLVRLQVLTGTWEDLEGTLLEVRGEKLLVRHTPSAQARIAALLEQFRAATTAQVELGVEFVRMSDATLRRILGPESRAILEPAAEKRLAEAIRTGQATVTRRSSLICADRQRTNLSELCQVSLVQDYDVEVAQTAAIADPIVQSIKDGHSIDLTPILDPDGRSVFIEVRVSCGKLHHPIEWFKTDAGSIQAPKLDGFKLRTSVTVPAGRAMVVGGTVAARSGESLLVIIRPRVLR